MKHPFIPEYCDIEHYLADPFHVRKVLTDIGSINFKIRTLSKEQLIEAFDKTWFNNIAKFFELWRVDPHDFYRWKTKGICYANTKKAVILFLGQSVCKRKEKGENVPKDFEIEKYLADPRVVRQAFFDINNVTFKMIDIPRFQLLYVFNKSWGWSLNKFFELWDIDSSEYEDWKNEKLNKDKIEKAIRIFLHKSLCRRKPWLTKRNESQKHYYIPELRDIESRLSDSRQVKRALISVGSINFRIRELSRDQLVIVFDEVWKQPFEKFFKFWRVDPHDFFRWRTGKSYFEHTEMAVKLFLGQSFVHKNNFQHEIIVYEPKN